MHELNGLYCRDNTILMSVGAPYVKVDDARRRLLPSASFVKLGCFGPAAWQLRDETGPQYVSICTGKLEPLHAEGWKPCGKACAPIALTSLLCPSAGSGFHYP